MTGHWPDLIEVLGDAVHFVEQGLFTLFSLFLDTGVYLHHSNHDLPAGHVQGASLLLPTSLRDRKGEETKDCQWVYIAHTFAAVEPPPHFSLQGLCMPECASLEIAIDA